MNDFTASNGITVANHGGNWDRTKIHFSGEVLGLTKDLSNARDVVFEDRDFEALREFFQAEADERLGRWRWPENPDYVVYLNDGYAVVVSESDPSRRPDRVHRRYLEDPEGSLGWGEFAARAYFDAHPDPKPLPTVEGVYAMHPRVHLYERFIMFRAGQWLHLHTSAGQFADGPSAEQIARTAVDEGRLTLLTPEVSS